MPAIICPNTTCNAEMPSNARFCMTCGTPLNHVELSAVPMEDLESMLDREDWNGLIARADKDIQQNPRDVKGYVLRATAYAGGGNPDRALADLNYAIKLEPARFELYALRGQIRADSGDHQGALTDLSYAVKLDANQAELYLQRGQIYHTLGDRKRALADFDRSMKLDPSDPELYMSRAVLFEDTGDIRRAINNMEEALELTADPYAQAQIEDLIRQLREYRSRKGRSQAGGFLKAVAIGVGRTAGAIVKESTRDILKP